MERITIIIKNYKKRTGTIQSICDSKQLFFFFQQNHVSCSGVTFIMTTPVFLEKSFFIFPIIIYFHFKEWTFLHPRQFQKIRVFQLENFWIIVNHIWDWLGDRAYKYSDNLPILEKIWYQNPSFIYRLKRWGLFSNTNGIYIIYLNKIKARTMTQTAGEKNLSF